MWSLHVLCVPAWFYPGSFPKNQKYTKEKRENKICSNALLCHFILDEYKISLDQPKLKPDETEIQRVSHKETAYVRTHLHNTDAHTIQM